MGSCGRLRGAPGGGTAGSWDALRFDKAYARERADWRVRRAPGSCPGRSAPSILLHDRLWSQGGRGGGRASEQSGRCGPPEKATRRLKTLTRGDVMPERRPDRSLIVATRTYRILL